jgi:hypothetical protein
MPTGLKPFFRSRLGMPYGERIMPQYIFAKPDTSSKVSIEYITEARPNGYWFERKVTIKMPKESQAFYQKFGPYGTEEEMELAINWIKKIDNSQPVVTSPTLVRK